MRWTTMLSRLGERIWFRLVVFSTAALALALAAPALGEALPAVSIDFGQDSVQRILEILATSMLAVTTFSLTAMISAYASAAQRTTPRATQLLIADHTSQNALSGFLGAFVFAVVGIAALSTDYYGETGRTVMFVAALVVIAFVVATLLRWIHHLTGFGRMADVIDRVERAASQAACEHARRPHLGGLAPVEVPAAAHAVTSDAVGVVTGVDMSALSEAASEDGLTIHVVATPGSAVGRDSTIMHVEGVLDGSAISRLRRCVRVERHRTFEQDPRLGLVALGEIGSRALSPSTNDPGSAIESLGAVERVLTDMLGTDPVDEAPHARIHVPSIDLADLVEDGIRPIARDGAGLVEIGLRIQHMLGHLATVVDASDLPVLRTASERSEERARIALADTGDADLVAEAARRARSAMASSRA